LSGIVILTVAGIVARSVVAHGGASVVQSRLVAAATVRPSMTPTETAYARREIPASYMSLYVRAADAYQLDWATLAAVGQIESRQGRSVFPGVTRGTNRAGAAGPAQFLSATWERYGVDGDGDGQINPYDPADAIASMASYLRASGAPEDWSKALFAYNHSQSYVDAVLAMSQRFDTRPDPALTAADH
jgi:membrane-bound lytic murein transglycosylase B